MRWWSVVQIRKKRHYLQEMQDSIAAKGLSNRITFVGHRSDIREWLAFSDLVLSLSSQAETFGQDCTRSTVL